MLERLFKLKAHGVTPHSEMVAGTTVFFTMAYILFVNPQILAAAGMDSGAVFMATAISAALTTAMMGLYANLPVALAPGMGQNAYFAFTVVPLLAGDWRLALGCVFLSGILFVAISASPAREWLINAIPDSQKRAIGAGIGLFLALIGFEGAGWVAASKDTLLQPGDLTSPRALIAAGGLMLIAALWARKVTGALLLGILAATATGIPIARRVVAVFVIHGAFAGLANILFATQLQVIQSTVPPNLELTIITASVIGGVSILGGSGTVIGSTLATILFATIGSALIFVNVSAYWLRAVIGLLILATVLADMMRRRGRGIGA